MLFYWLIIISIILFLFQGIINKYVMKQASQRKNFFDTTMNVIVNYIQLYSQTLMIQFKQKLIIPNKNITSC